ncbi:winged helix-turn-helix domain-containing protein [Streptomyces erythrochromogenes]|uniref:helix-turn-helix domain-containing protein n=1 Tax=Streptomyces erythrochromogenes TaxID=285574 RepID=UPI00342D5C44
MVQGAGVGGEALGRAWARLETELRCGPPARGFEDDQRWTLKRIKLLICRVFHVGYTVQGVWKLLRRHGWSCRVPVRRAVERDGASVELWKQEVWPEVEERWRTWVPTPASKTKQDRP